MKITCVFFRCRLCFNVSLSYRNIIQIELKDVWLPNTFLGLWCHNLISFCRQYQSWLVFFIIYVLYYDLVPEASATREGAKNSTSLLVADNAKIDARILIWLTNMQTLDGRFFKWHCRIYTKKLIQTGECINYM